MAITTIQKPPIMRRFTPPRELELAALRLASGVSLKNLFVLGITGGIVPCPAALVVLLGALALQRIVFGLFLIVAFSFGLAAVLIGFGLAIVYAQRFMTRFGSEGPDDRTLAPTCVIRRNNCRRPRIDA